MQALNKSILALMSALMLLSACAIRDDFPLPLRLSQITSFEVEGQCNADGHGTGSATINPDERTIDVYVCDTVDIRHLRIKSLTASKNATITLSNEEGTTELEQGIDSTTVGKVYADFSQPVHVTLHTYQEYEWTIRVHQVINREVALSGQVGNAIIDPINQNVIVYVSTSQSLINVQVHKFSIGGEHGTVSPDPTLEESCNLGRMTTYDVTYGYSNEVHKWQLFVYQTDEVIGTTADVFPHSVKAYVSGKMQNGTRPVVEYCEAGTDNWHTLAEDQVKTSAASYLAVISGLTPGTDYECRVQAGDLGSGIKRFTTAPGLQVENGNLDDWHIEGEGKKALYNPWAKGSKSYWDTGNRGATTVGASNSTFVVEDGRTYANLQSKYIVIKFAAGNIFTGSYLKTDGTNGILTFGHPFSSFPTHLQFEYRYQTSTINKGSNSWDEAYSKYMTREAYEGLLGKPDTCQVFVALFGDKDEEEFEGEVYPFVVRTRPSTLKLFTFDNDNVIAYASFVQGKSVNDWTRVTVPIQYKYWDRTPKYIVIVASSSKFGDYFTGGDQSLLQLDNIRLLYE